MKLTATAQHSGLQLSIAEKVADDGYMVSAEQAGALGSKPVSAYQLSAALSKAAYDVGLDPRINAKSEIQPNDIKRLDAEQVFVHRRVFEALERKRWEPVRVPHRNGRIERSLGEIGIDGFGVNRTIPRFVFSMADTIGISSVGRG